MRNRLIGLVIVVVVLFLLSWLIPGHQSAHNEHSIPVSAIPVGSASVATVSSTTQPAQATAADVAAGGMAPPNDDEIHTQSYQAAGRTAETAAASADSARSQPSAAQTASQYATGSTPSKAESPKAKAPQSAPKPAAKKPPARTPSPAASGNAYVQIGSYGETANAQKMLSSLQHQGFHGRIDRAVVKGKAYYRVRVGPYADTDAATAAQRQLTAKGFKGTQVIGGS